VCPAMHFHNAFSMYPLQTWWEHSMGHDMWRGLLCVCVCNVRMLIVCACVCSLIFGRIISKCAWNILRITTSCMGCERHAHVDVRLNLDGFSPNLVGIYYRSPRVAFATYFPIHASFTDDLRTLPSF
jgi:hypothetical protein